MKIKRPKGSGGRFILSRRDVTMMLVGGVAGAMIMFVLGGGGGYSYGCLLDSPALSKSYPNSATSSSPGYKNNNRRMKPVSNLPDGFHPIYSYYGKFNHLYEPIPTKWWLQTSPLHSQPPIIEGNNDNNNNDNRIVTGEWFSQHAQDEGVAKFFKFRPNGYFVDLAANDAVWASNTFSLEQNYGWSGICIEANPQYWYRLSFRNCHVVGAIVGSSLEPNAEVEVVLGEAHHGPFGGIIREDFDNKGPPKKKGKETPPDKRYAVPLGTILDTFGAPSVIDYLSLDVEGAETYIMKGFDFNKYRFLTMSVERPKDELIQIFQQNGYRKVKDFKRGDTLWAHQSIYDDGVKNLDMSDDEMLPFKIKNVVRD